MLRSGSARSSRSGLAGEFYERRNETKARDGEERQNGGGSSDGGMSVLE